MAYTALYREWRPRTFNDVVGQEHITTTLKNQVLNNRIAHAYLFCGTRGTGKTSTAKVFAKALNCLNLIDGEPCNQCEMCRKINEGLAIDVTELDAASNNGVDKIRDIIDDVKYPPQEAKYKVYIMDEVHMLSTGAVNAFLKTLEEPPRNVIFILATTDPQKVPETIISRCQCFSFERISNECIYSRLKYVCDCEKIEIDNDVLNEISMVSDGGLRDALGILDKLRSYCDNKITINDFYELNGLVNKEMLKKFINYIFSANISDLLNEINYLNNSGKNLVQILSQLIFYLRNLIMDYYVNNVSCEYDIVDLEKLINYLNENMFDIKKSDNIRISIELLLMKFINNNKNNSNSNFSSSNDNNNIDINKKVEIKNDKNIMEKDFINNNVVNKSNNVSITKKENVILNLDDIISVRINNCFCKADKNKLIDYQKKKDSLAEYSFNKEYGYLVCELLDSNFRVASENIIVISFDYESKVKNNLLSLHNLEDIFNKLTNSKICFAIISDEKWNVEKNNYISNVKFGKKYEIIDEPEEVFEDVKKNDIISSSAIDLFGDIVEIEK